MNLANELFARQFGLKPFHIRPYTINTATRIATSCAASYNTRHSHQPIDSLITFSISSGLGFGTVAATATGVYKRLFRRRPTQNRHRALQNEMGAGPRAIFSVATFNLRGISDRWHEREPLLKQCIEDIDADVLCFQECMTGEYGQDRRLLNSSYHTFPCKTALFNLIANDGVLGLYARACEGALKVLPIQRLMVYMPTAWESIREKFTLKNSIFTILSMLSLAPFFGNSIGCRLADAHTIKHNTLLLGDWRAAQRIEFSLDYTDEEEEPQLEAGGSPRTHALVGNADTNNTSAMKIWIVNTHLDHEHPDNRQRQALQVANWMDQVRNEAAAVILCGDFNGNPDEPFHQVFQSLGYRSAHKERHGREPEGTWPTGIKAPLMDHGAFECLDYVYVWAAEGYDVKVLDAEVYGLKPAVHDKTLYPSDHAAIKATVEVKQVAAAGNSKTSD